MKYVIIIALGLAFPLGAMAFHGMGANDGYALGLDAAETRCSEQGVASRLAADQMIADAYMDNAVLRERLTDLQERYAAQWERAEQATAQRDYARSRLGAYEPRFRDHPIDALAAPRPGTTTSQLR